LFFGRKLGPALRGGRRKSGVERRGGRSSTISQRPEKGNPRGGTRVGLCQKAREKQIDFPNDKSSQAGGKRGIKPRGKGKKKFKRGPDQSAEKDRLGGPFRLESIKGSSHNYTQSSGREKRKEAEARKKKL